MIGVEASDQHADAARLRPDWHERLSGGSELPEQGDHRVLTFQPGALQGPYAPGYGRARRPSPDFSLGMTMYTRSPMAGDEMQPYPTISPQHRIPTTRPGDKGPSCDHTWNYASNVTSRRVQ